MAMWNSFTTARDQGRLHEIASILVRHGFGDLIRRMGLESVLAQDLDLRHDPRAARGVGPLRPADAELMLG